MSDVKNILKDKKENIIIFLQVIVIPIFFWFDGRLSELEKPNSGRDVKIEEIEKKIDKMLLLIEKAQNEQMQFYKDYGAALEFSKRELQKK